MLKNLTIKNYAIIKHLDVNFDRGFCVVTGETGAGKSIIMGALALILGQRADSSVMNDKQGKCVVEGRFDVEKNIQLEDLFNDNELDLEIPVILRREINSSGKSRAFVNDTPVQLNILRELGLMLIDIHSQHANLDLGKRQFQLNVLDWYCGHKNLLNDYHSLYVEYQTLQKQFEHINTLAEQSKTDIDYFEFQFKQLDEARLIEGEQSELEQEQEVLNHSEEIKTGLDNVCRLLDNEDTGALLSIKQSLSVLTKLSSFLPQANELASRAESTLIELRDIADECEQLAEKTAYDPGRLELVTDRLNLLFSLEQKHHVDTVGELIALKNEFSDKIDAVASYDLELEKLSKAIEKQRILLTDAALKLHNSRAEKINGIVNEVSTYLYQLGMPNALFNIELITKEQFGPAGTDEVYFMFAANKAGQLEEINKVASGGELSRLMLAIKTVVAKSKALPAIIFDEIDTGISGEIALKMGNILRQMANYMQVINITHLPQIASKGMSHYKVYKTEDQNGAETSIAKLNNNERVVEIAKMLSGEVPHQAAIDNAKILLDLSVNQ
ncbi:MAG TPA: DNA repair protein RecN [Prolixibacteraceae bacterium]|nr:DNA repair protein RecN [Prolixibacteraceae bacterium]